MAKRLQLRRGTATEHSSFTGAIGELTYDTTNKKLKIHDGSTVGGLNVGCSISISRSITSGTKIADITIDGTTSSLYYNDNDSHYTTHLYVGASGSASNAATTNGNTYLKIYDDSTARESFKISGSGSVSVASDSSGNITISGTGIPLNGARGSLAGYETVGSATTINATCADCSEVSSNITVSNGTSGTAWTKIVRVTAAVTVTLGSNWKWAGNEAPTITAGGIFLFCWCGSAGIANFMPNS